MGDKNIILIVGMARSGTTLVTNTIGGLNGVDVFVEPHALWKTGNYHYFNDEEYDIVEKNTSFIRNTFETFCESKNLIEKSPINCIRPEMVKAVFPEAKIIYVERDPVKCVESNYKRTLANDSFKLSIILKKYLGKSGSEDLPNARSNFSLLKQLQQSDLFDFFRNTSYMFYQRNVGMKQFPFGTKLKNFKEIVENEGILSYHVKVYKKAHELKSIYESLFNNILFVRMEEITTSKSKMKEMLDFTSIDYREKELNTVYNQLDQDRVKKSVKTSKIDVEIEKLFSSIL